jgi:PAS domain S-box-containing protein
MDNAAPNRRLLIVDDNVAIHDDFRKILQPEAEEADPFEAAAFGAGKVGADSRRFDIDSAYQGQEALDKVRTAVSEGSRYAVVFMDVRMPPGWDGIETTAKLWEQDPDLQVVICTAYSDYSWEEMIGKLGCSDRLVILKKPFDPIEVIQLADCLTTKWQLLQESKSRLAELEKLVAERTAQIVTEQARFRAIFENSPMGIFQTSQEGRILCANPASVKMVGYDSPAELTQELTKIGAQLYVEAKRRDEFMRLVARDGIVRDFEFKVKCRDGSQKWLNLTAYGVKAPDGSLLYYEGFFYDLTDRKRAEQERNEMEVQLRHAQKMESIGCLSAGIAHEINTPAQYVGDNIHFFRDSFMGIQTVLAAFQKFFEAAKENRLTASSIAEVEACLTEADIEYLCKEIPTAIEQSQEGVGRISKIVSALKEFSHPGHREKLFADLNRAIETTALVARNEWKYVAELKLDLDPKLPAVPCFVSEFNQAILNLVINAAQTIGDVVGPNSGNKGQISIRTRRDNDQIEVRVSDTGTGIPEAIRPHIFEPFFTTKEVGKGTGQGLTVVYNSIVKLHQGTVTFESEVGKGTTFILRLPANPS